MAPSNNKKTYTLLLGFALFLILFMVFTQKTNFHDTPEHIIASKELAELNNSKIYSAHSLLYPLFLAQFLKVFPYMVTLKIVNIFWLVLDALLLWLLFKDKRALLIFIFSPLVWTTAPQIAPILPSSSLILLAYYFFKKWEVSESKNYFIFSAIFLGLASAIYEAAMAIAVIFIFVFFYNKKLINVFYYLIAFLIGFSPILILNQLLFSFPFYSHLRFFGANIIVTLGLRSDFNILTLMFAKEFLPILIFIISPLLFIRIFKIKYKRNKKIIWFFILNAIIFWMWGANTLYFLAILPMIALMLSSVIKKKWLILHIVLSTIIILILIYPFFQTSRENEIAYDIKQIIKEYPNENYVAYGRESSQSLYVLHLFDKNQPRILWMSEYLAIKNKNNVLTENTINFKPKINTHKYPEFTYRLQYNKGEEIENPYFIVENDAESPKDLKLIKKYKVLSLYSL